MMKILSDEATYVSLPNDPTGKYKKDLGKLIDEGFKNDILNKKRNCSFYPWDLEYQSSIIFPKSTKIQLIPQVGQSLVDWIR